MQLCVVMCTGNDSRGCPFPWHKQSNAASWRQSLAALAEVNRKQERQSHMWDHAFLVYVFQQMSFNISCIDAVLLPPAAS